MENFKRLKKTIVHAELHGFRFSSELTGDFDDVTISCTVKVCTGTGGKCKDVSVFYSQITIVKCHASEFFSINLHQKHRNI